MFVLQLLVILVLVAVIWSYRKDYSTGRELIAAGAEVRAAGTFQFGKYGNIELLMFDDRQQQSDELSADQITGVFVLSDDWNRECVLERLKDLPNLELVCLENRSICDDDLEYLKALNSVRMFDLAGTNITDEGLLTLTSCNALEIIAVGKTSVSSKAIEEYNKARPEVFVSKRRR